MIDWKKEGCGKIFKLLVALLKKFFQRLLWCIFHCQNFSLFLLSNLMKIPIMRIFLVYSIHVIGLNIWLWDPFFNKYVKLQEFYFDTVIKWQADFKSKALFWGVNVFKIHKEVDSWLQKQRFQNKCVIKDNLYKSSSFQNVYNIFKFTFTVWHFNCPTNMPINLIKIKLKSKKSTS